jgi:hypothetical protein
MTSKKKRDSAVLGTQVHFQRQNGVNTNTSGLSLHLPGKPSGRRGDFTDISWEYARYEIYIDIYIHICVNMLYIHNYTIYTLYVYIDKIEKRWNGMRTRKAPSRCRFASFLAGFKLLVPEKLNTIP